MLFLLPVPKTAPALAIEASAPALEVAEGTIETAAAQETLSAAAVPERTLYGPYYHIARTPEDAAEIVSSRELWGQAPRGIFQDFMPAAKAHTVEGLAMRGGPTAGTTVEFWTTVEPNAAAGQAWRMWRVQMTPNLEVIGPLPPGLRLGAGANNADIAILDLVDPRIVGP